MGAGLPSTHQGRPRLSNILTSSKKLRLVVAFVFASALLLFLLHTYGATLSTVQRSWFRQQGNSPIPMPLGIDWSKFAYTQYVTNSDYLCNSVMLFEILYRLGSRADRVMMYPARMFDPNSVSGSLSHDAKLLIKARDEYGVRLVPISVQHRDVEDGTWADSFTKLLAFNQTDYDRVLSLDSDGTIMQPMDELFLLPPSRVAMPRAYWLYPEKQILSSQIMLVEPSAEEFERVMERVNSAAENAYDMEIVNDLYKDNALVIPHRPYDMLTAEFRTEEHAAYLGSDREKWDPVSAYNEAKYIHFSDWPVAKPWRFTPDEVLEEKRPKCRTVEGEELCTEKDIWNGLYADFLARRKDICDLDQITGIRPKRKSVSHTRA